MFRTGMFAVAAATLAVAVPSTQAATNSAAVTFAATDVTAGPVEPVQPASAAEGWTGGMVVDRSGTATMVWSRSGVGQYAAQRSPSGVWSEPQLIGCAGEAGCGNTRLGVDARGRVTVVADRSANQSDVVAWTKSPDGPWSPPVILTRGRRQGYESRLAVAPNGAVVVAWQRIDGKGSVVLRKPAGRGWAGAVSTKFDQTTDDVAIGRYGTVLAIGTNSFDVRSPKVLLNVFRPGLGWRPTRLIGRSGGEQPIPHVSLGRHGRAAATWTTWSPDRTRSAVVVRRMRADSTWSRPKRISRWLGDPGTPFVKDVAVGPHGWVTVMWMSRTDRATTRLPDGTWVSRRLLPTGGGWAFGQLSGNQSGARAVSWLVLNYENPEQYTEEVHVSLRSAGSLAWRKSASLGTTFGGTAERGDGGGRPFSVAVMPDGSALVCWFDLSGALVARTVR